MGKRACRDAELFLFLPCCEASLSLVGKGGSLAARFDVGKSAHHLLLSQDPHFHPAQTPNSPGGCREKKSGIY